jgi:hypothetical protein
VDIYFIGELEVSEDYGWLSNEGWRIEKGDWLPAHNKIKETGDTGSS